ncbi:hypothetical protein BU24DRAFT_422957 [Aaosphaeria arxii CBS 175.79]|uniref:WD40 repeat-like protein n=1 Tax=Aaosphaeria arxii CBS 175.79 TaxID=1450172 RepID=A0A6A5XWG5_9PLEO|nr:uncharacterized protein BU24DRAFT_422957 [Aaosphaeria arxii CBS 175.79]KAF2016584.1 hypothetical protein BU24DRAFT_422957 [Aaosphaeria arxii CBS 175.79]
MSQQHINLAKVWQHLQGRQDISNILREIIGDLALHHGETYEIEVSIQKIIWIKVIFDLQRTYLTGDGAGIAGCPSYMLPCLVPQELLLSTIFFLVDVKSRLFPSQTTLMTREYTRPRHMLSQTLLSGLRLLMLRKEDIAARDRQRLQNLINKAWQHDRLQGVEGFVVSELFAGTLDLLNDLLNGGRDPHARERACAKLPSWHVGLYPLEIQPETFVTSLIHGTMEEDWASAYWVLYDCLWAVESAVTQRFVDIARSTVSFDENQLAIDTDEILENLYQTRTSFIISVFHQVSGPMLPTPELLDSLAITLLDWSADLNIFLTRQDSLHQHQSPVTPAPSRAPNYRKHVVEISPYLEDAMVSLAAWLAQHRTSGEQISVRKTAITSNDVQDIVKDWIMRTTSAPKESLSRELERSLPSIYVVDCPKLHALPKQLLEYELRWCDKWAYEGMKENSPMVTWKEGIACPGCTTGEKVKRARLIEPIQLISSALETPKSDTQSVSHSSGGDTGSFEAGSASMTSRSASEANASAFSNPEPFNTVMTVPTQLSQASQDTNNSGQPPGYSESPIDPAPFTPLTPISPRSHSYGSSSMDTPISPVLESLNVPIPRVNRMSVDLPIPVPTSSSEFFSSSLPQRTISASSASSSARMSTTPTDTMGSGSSLSKKPTSRTVRIANSMRRKPTPKIKEAYPLPKDPSFSFSTSGHTLLLWGKDHLVRFDIPSNNVSATQGCRYEIDGIEAAAAGNHKCAIITRNNSTTHTLTVYNGLSLQPEHEIGVKFSGHAGKICLAVSRNDRYIAASMSDDIHVFCLDGGIKSIPFHNQLQVFELRGGNPHHRTLTMGRTTSDENFTERRGSESGWIDAQRGLSSKEKAEEDRRRSAVVSRRIYFSTDSTQLVVATQQADHCVYVDVWDCTREPISTISEHSRSFRMPPYTLNDGDLTSVFYDSERRNVVCTGFLGKEYPMLIPFPGYETLQNETYSTKIVHATQSPSGSSIIVANAMTEMIQFEYTSKGTFSPRKLRKSPAKISNSAFKPGAIALAMPLEDSLQCFWIKDGKCILRSIKIGSGETVKDYDLRPHYDRLMSLKDRPIVARAPSLHIPELDGG